MANKATNFIKQYFFMLALAATFVGFSAFKYTAPNVAQSGWYSISNDEDPEDQQIISHLDEGLESEICDVSQQFTPPCAVYLDMTQFNQNQDPTDLTVAEAVDDFGATIDKTTSGSIDGYARQVPQ